MHKLLILILASVTLASPFTHARDITPAQLSIRKFREITPAIYAGGNPVKRPPDYRGLDALKNLGIAVNINLQGGDIDGTLIGRIAYLIQKGEFPAAIAFEKEYLETRGIRFHNFPLNSHAPKTEIEDAGIRLALKLMSEATAESPLYIHCEHGSDRTGLLIALYRVIHQGWTRTEANREWIRNGHSAAAKAITWHLDVYFNRFIDEHEANTGPKNAREESGAACAPDLET